MTIGRALKIAANLIASSTSPKLDAEVLLAYVLKCERHHLITLTENPLNLRHTSKYFYLILKRRFNWPLAYLTGYKEFYGRQFKLNRRVLVPRPETELLVEETIKLVNQSPADIKKIVDIGTGSGCLAITLALELPEVSILATDISEKALTIAKSNAKNWQIKRPLIFLQGDILEPLLKNELLDRTTLLVANPPYLQASELTPELKHEPEMALVSGRDGLAWHKKLLQQLKSITPDRLPAIVVLEINPLTVTNLLNLIKTQFVNSQIKLQPDLAGRHRLAIINLKA